MSPDFPDHFSERAPAYATHRPGYPDDLVDFLAGLPERSGVAWDAGCGPGRLSVALASRFRRVVATDASREQLEGAPRRPGIHYRQELADAGSLPDAVVDLAVAGQAAHWFDLDGYYAEVRRVTRTGAAIALVSYGMARVCEAVDRVVDRFYEEVLEPHWPPERRHVESGYRTLPFPFPEVETPSFEIRTSWTGRAMAGYVETWSAVRSLETEEGTGPFEAFRKELEAAWGGADERRTVRWPLSLRVGRP